MSRFAIAMVFLLGCGPGAPGGPSINNSMTGNQQTATVTVESTEILDREPRSNHTKVKHILISWKDLEQGGKDPRAQARTKEDAETLVRSLMTQIKAGADFDMLLKQHSEDPGSNKNAMTYDVSTDARLVIEFKNLGLRLNVDEVGVIQSEFGFHIMKRTE